MAQFLDRVIFFVITLFTLPSIKQEMAFIVTLYANSMDGLLFVIL